MLPVFVAPRGKEGRKGRSQGLTQGDKWAVRYLTCFHFLRWRLVRVGEDEEEEEDEGEKKKRKTEQEEK